MLNLFERQYTNRSISMKNTFRLIAPILTMAITITPTITSASSWTDWTSDNGSTVSGTVSGVTVTTNIDNSDFAQLNENPASTNYFTGFSGYTTPYGANGPTSSDIIGLSDASTQNIQFSSAVTDPLIAIVSWNGNNINFASQYNAILLSSGCGWWGCEGGTNLNNSTPISGSNGIIELQGTFTNISFTVPNYEDWHGFTVGIEGVADNNIPEPSSIALLGIGFLGFVAARRKNLPKVIDFNPETQRYC